MSCTSNLLRMSTCALLLAGVGACAEEAATETTEEAELLGALPNGFPHLNTSGLNASFSLQGRISLTNAFSTPQGTNGRSCATCHVPSDGWSITPTTARIWFELTGGKHPLFSRLDADRPDYTDEQISAMTVNQRRKIFTKLLDGMFTRSINVPATRDYDVIAANDPFGVGTTSRLWFFRRSMPTANFKSHPVSWDGANTVGTDLYAGLVRQARGNVTGAQQGPAASDETIFEIVDHEILMSNAQIMTIGAGSLTAGGAKGGPEAHATQDLVAGRFDLYDAWKNSGNPFRKAIYRGQELFNKGDKNGRSCGGCHNAANDGQNVEGRLFDIGVSHPRFKTNSMAVYTFQRRSDGAIVETTDPGRAGRSGQFADMNRFKTPSLRGAASRAPYFHNGIAKDLRDVVRIYEKSLGFDFTDREEADLAAFLSAL